eukprot:1160212-Pelagomonas_calceolata.AAC.7
MLPPGTMRYHRAFRGAVPVEVLSGYLQLLTTPGAVARDSLGFMLGAGQLLGAQKEDVGSEYQPEQEPTRMVQAVTPASAAIGGQIMSVLAITFRSISVSVVVMLAGGGLVRGSTKVGPAYEVMLGRLVPACRLTRSGGAAHFADDSFECLQWLKAAAAAASMAELLSFQDATAPPLTVLLCPPAPPLTNSALVSACPELGVVFLA